MGGLIALVLIGGLFVVEDAQASHLRALELSWEPVEGGEENEVVFTGSFAARKSFYGSHVQVGDQIDSTTLYLGDGDLGSLVFEVDAVNEEEDWVSGSLVDSSGENLHHTYPSPDDDGEPFDVRVLHCCRLAARTDQGVPVEAFHANNPNHRMRAQTLVDLNAAPNGAPSDDLSFVKDCELDAICSFEIPYDHDGGDVSFRLATADEAGDDRYIPPGPPNSSEPLTIDEQTGVVTWNTTGATHEPDGDSWDSLYSVQIMLEADGVKAPVDFMIRVYPNVPDEPRGLVTEAGPDPGEITVTWDRPRDDGGASIEGYTVYAAESTDGSFTKIGSVGPDTDVLIEQGLDDDQTRCYRVTAENRIGEGARTSAQCSTTFAVPDAPENVAAAAGPDTGEITVSWEAPSDDGGTSITGYTVYGAEDAGGPFTTVTSVSATTRQSTEQGLDADQTRYYHVTADNEVGEGNASEVATATTFTTPGPPKNLEADPGPGAGEITVRWDPPADDGGTPITGYRISACTDCSGYIPLVGTVDAGTRTFTEDGLDPGQHRTYWVRAVNGVGYGEERQTSAQAFEVPDPPENVDARPGLGLGAVEITWEEPRFKGRAELTGYGVYRSTEAGAGFERVATVGPEAPAYTDTGQLLVTYHYHVTAETIAGESGPSASDCTKPFPWEPTGNEQLCLLPSPQSPE